MGVYERQLVRQAPPPGPASYLRYADGTISQTQCDGGCITEETQQQADCAARIPSSFGRFEGKFELKLEQICIL